ncbi:type II secretory pathway protein [Psychrobium sp. nBUS_13]|uniref:pilus assembly PilX family protein n=1 Tax=Psychrobium sp. nBUS_13 TaxID=3395319 RepID=UPI003EC05A3D
MFPNVKDDTSIKNQQGSMLVIALFVIIVLAFLAYAMIQITDNSSRGNVYEVYGDRALNAANSGAERALNEILMPSVAGTESCALVSSGYLLGAGDVFNGCNIIISCNEFLVTETGYTHFRIESTASCSAGDFYTQRSVVVEARIN